MNRPELEGLPACGPDGRHWFWHGEHVLRILDHHRPMRCVELGTFRGSSAIAIARTIRGWGGHLTCVDVWERENRDLGITVRECADNIREAGVADAVTLVQARTDEAADNWSLPIDFLYIDADHSYEGCLADLERWWPYVRQGGVLAGDDYGDACPGVKRAWDEFAARHGQGLACEVTPGIEHWLVWGVKW